MSRWTILALLWPILLLFGGRSHDELKHRWHQQRLIQARLDQRLRELESLRAKTVAGRIDSQEYQRLALELAALTRLPASNPFRDPHETSLGSVHIASLISGLQKSLASAARDDSADSSEPGEPLRFLSVSPGVQQSVGPFVMVEFALNLKGRFRAIPPFLATLTELGKRRNLAISIGELRISSTEQTPVNGELEITLPVRAYYRD